MNPSNTANLALALAPAGWLLSAWGALSQLGDPAPWTSGAALASQHAVSLVVLFVGCVCLFGALWLSGHAFSGAPRRSLLALVACLGPFAVGFVSTFW